MVSGIFNRLMMRAHACNIINNIDRRRSKRLRVVNETQFDGELMTNICVRRMWNKKK